MIPLTTDVDPDIAVKSLNESVEVKEEDLKCYDGMVKVFVERFKQNVAFCAVKRDLLAVLEVCRAADFVVLVVSAKEEVDAYGELILRSIEGQGISNVVTVVQVCFSRTLIREYGQGLTWHRDLTLLSRRKKGRRLLLRSDRLLHTSSLRLRRSIRWIRDRNA